MIIVLKAGSSDAEVEDVCRRIERMGYRAHTIRGELRTVIGAVGDDRGKDRLKSLESLECVEAVQPILQPFKLASREVRREATVISVDGVGIGGTEIVVMAGPCSVESREQVFEVAAKVKAAGARILRGGAFKPRTSPYSFQGLEEEGLKYLAEAKRETGLPVVTEVMEPEKVDLVAHYADILQIGARSIQNFSLLRRVAETKKPSHLPVVVDPSHGTGHWEYVESMALAGVAAGADGLIIEVHPRPEEALSDGPQSLKPDRFAALVDRVRRVARALDRDL